jgi:hypothetical protein
MAPLCPSVPSFRVLDARCVDATTHDPRPAQVKLRNPKKSTGFFEYDRKVLRFYGIWDSRARLFGDQVPISCPRLLLLLRQPCPSERPLT